MQSKLYGKLWEIQYNRFFLKCRFVSLHNNFEKIKEKELYRFAKKKKNDKAFTVLVYFFKNFSMRMGYTHFSLVCQCNDERRFFIRDLISSSFDAEEKKKKERRADL